MQPKSGLQRAFSLLFAFFLVFSFLQAPAAQAQDPLPDDLPIKHYLPIMYVPEKPLWMGPGGGGYIIHIAADPSDPDVVYATTLNTGIYKSEDRGKSWVAINKGLGNLFVNHIAISPDGQTLYAATQGSGIYKSTDAGATWAAANSGVVQPAVVYSIAVNPSNPNIVLAGTRVENTFYHGILYRSTNGGASWTRLIEFSDGWFYSVTFNPANPIQALAAVHEKGVWMSNDYGEHFTRVGPGLSPDDRWKKGRAVAFGPVNRAYYTAWQDYLVAYSANNGTNWAGASVPAPAQVYPNGISVDPDNASSVFLADHNHNVVNNVLLPGTILKSTNSGVSYTQVLAGRNFYTVRALGGDAPGVSTVLAGTAGYGIWSSTQGGDPGTWQISMDGINFARVTGIIWLPGGEGYASSTTGGGVFKTIDSGAHWSNFNAGLGSDIVNKLVQHPDNPRILYALTSGAGLRKVNLDDAVPTWSSTAKITPSAAQLEMLSQVERGEEQELPPDFTPGDEAGMLAIEPAAVDNAPIYDMAFAPSNHAIAYLGTGNGVYKIEGDGSWTYKSLSGQTVKAVAVHPTNPNRVYAVVDNPSGADLPYISNDGSSFVAISSRPAWDYYAVLTVPEDPDGAYFATSNGVFRYNGSSWTQVMLAGVSVRALAVHPYLPDTWIAATRSGAYICTYSSLSCGPVDTTMAGTDLISIGFDASDPAHVYFGTVQRSTVRLRVIP